MSEPKVHDVSVIINLIAIRKSIHELSFCIAFIVLGFLVSHWWSEAAIVAAAGVCMGALISYFWDRDTEKTLQKIYWKLANAEDAEEG